MKRSLTLLLFLLIQCIVRAQSVYNISGTVKNAKGDNMQSATVFIAGSEKATATGADGQFKFNGLIPGTYQLVVNLIGYAPVKQNVIIKDADEAINLTVTEKTIMLDEVIIGNKNTRAKYVKTFIESFMGESANAKYCKILNPDLLEFSTNKGVLKATTADFLIIENNALGYRIKYLLKKFLHEEARNMTMYDGDYSFEQMTGTPEQQKIWEKKRFEAYQGSLMQYLRALYGGTTRQEGFLIYKILGPLTLPLSIETIPVIPEQLIDRSDKNLITFKYDMRFYILFDKKKAAKRDPEFAEKWVMSELDKCGSIFNTDARVDSRGSFTNYEKLLIQGFWGHKRVADQLPWEYKPTNEVVN